MQILKLLVSKITCIVKLERPPTKTLILNGAFNFVMIFTSCLGTVMPLIEVTSEDLKPAVWLFTFSMVPWQFFYYFTYFQVTTIYLQMCYNLKLMANEIYLSDIQPKCLLESTGQLLNFVNAISKFLSSQCFHLISLSLFYLIILVFLTIDFSSSSNVFHWLIYIGLISGAFYFGSILWILNIQSEDIKQSLGIIKNLILNLVASRNLVKINGNYHTEGYARILLINMLDGFKGFDIDGYVNLGKPLLIAILSHSITLIVILIEMKMNIL